LSTVWCQPSVDAVTAGLAAFGGQRGYGIQPNPAVQEVPKAAPGPRHRDHRTDHPGAHGGRREAGQPGRWRVNQRVAAAGRQGSRPRRGGRGRARGPGRARGQADQLRGVTQLHTRHVRSRIHLPGVQFVHSRQAAPAARSGGQRVGRRRGAAGYTTGRRRQRRQPARTGPGPPRAWLGTARLCSEHEPECRIRIPAPCGPFGVGRYGGRRHIFTWHSTTESSHAPC
jgi:hypothetical protein